MKLFRYRSRCGLLAIDEQSDQTFRVREQPGYTGVPAIVLVEEVLGERLDALRAQEIEAGAEELRRIPSVVRLIERA
jgi:hypothetical protein